MKKKFLTGLITSATLFAVTACGGGGVFAGSYGDYIDTVKGKVVTKLLHYDDPTTEEDESLKSLDVQWFKYTESTIDYDIDKTPILTESTIHAKLEDGLELKVTVDGRTQEHFIIDVQHNKEKEKVLAEQKTPASVFMTNYYTFDRAKSELFYEHAIVNEETILYDIESEETKDVIGKAYTTYFNLFHTTLESLYDPVLNYGDINNLKLGEDATEHDSIFSNLSWDVNKYLDYKTPVDETTKERLLVSAKLTSCEQLNFDQAIHVFSPKALFYKSISVYTIHGDLLIKHLFDIKEWDRGQDILAPKQENIAPSESTPDITETSTEEVTSESAAE